MLKKLLLLVSLVFVLFSCEKDELNLDPDLCVWPVGEHFESVYLYDDGEVFGEGGMGYCKNNGFLQFYAEPIEGYEFYKWCGYDDYWNGPTASRFSNPIILGTFGPMTRYVELEITPIYRKIGEPAPFESCDRTLGGLNGE